MWFLLGIPVGWVLRAWLKEKETRLGDMSNSDWAKGYSDATAGNERSPPLLWGKDDYENGYRSGLGTRRDAAMLKAQLQSQGIMPRDSSDDYY